MFMSESSNRNLCLEKMIKKENIFCCCDFFAGVIAQIVEKVSMAFYKFLDFVTVINSFVLFDVRWTLVRIHQTVLFGGHIF